MLAFIAKLVFEGLVLVIIVGAVLSMIFQFTRARWTRHLALRTIAAAAYFLCAPARQLLKAIGVPTAPIDFSPLLAILGLRVLQWVVVGVLRFFP